ncbi:MAG: ABC transporter permease, partial [Acidobacteriota bacterium]
VALLVGAASVVAFALANGVLGYILGLIEEAPFWLRFSPGPRTAAAAALLAAIATVAAGLGPSLGATRRHLSQELKAGGRGGGGLRMGRLAATLTVLQMAISVAFVGASLAVAQGALRYMDPGIALPTDRILTCQFGFRRSPEEADGGDVRASIAARLDAVVEAVRAVPGIETVGVATALPGERAEMTWVHLEAEEQDGPARAVSVSTAELLPGFLKAVGATPLRGRFFEDADRAENAHPVAVVNELFVEKLFGQRHALGHRLRLLDEDGSPGPWMEIVGVAPNLGMSPGNPELGAGVYVPIRPRRWMRLAMRVEGEPAAMGGALRKAVGDVDVDTTMIRVQPLSKVASEEALTLSLFGSGLVALGLTALLLSLAGIFAMTSLAVSQRTREIGIRLALGAGRREILTVVSKRASLHLGIGAAVGVALGGLLLAFVEAQETGLVAGSVWGLAATALILAAVALVACAIPARKVLRVDPSRALAQDP